MRIVKLCISSSGIFKDRFEVLVRDSSLELLKPGLLERVYSEILNLASCRHRVVVTLLMNQTKIKIKMDMVKNTSFICLLGIGLGLGLGSLLIYKLYDCLWASSKGNTSGSGSSASTTCKDTDSKNNNNNECLGKEKSEKRKLRKRHHTNRKRARMGNHQGYMSDQRVFYDGRDVNFLRCETHSGYEVISTSPSYPGTTNHRRASSSRPRKKPLNSKSGPSFVSYATSCSAKLSPLKSEQSRPLLSQSLDTSDSEYENESVHSQSSRNFRRYSLSDDFKCNARQLRSCSTPTNLAVHPGLMDSDGGLDKISMIANFSPCSLTERNFRLDAADETCHEIGSDVSLVESSSFCNINSKSEVAPGSNPLAETADSANSSMTIISEGPSSSWDIIRGASDVSNFLMNRSDTTIIADDEVCCTKRDNGVVGGNDEEKMTNSVFREKTSNEQFYYDSSKLFLPRPRAVSEPVCDEDCRVHLCTCHTHRHLSAGESWCGSHVKHEDNHISKAVWHRRTSSLGGAERNSSREGSIQRELEDVLSQTSSSNSSPMKQKLLEQLGYTSDASDTPLSPQTLKEIFHKRDWSTFSDIENTGSTTPYESDDDSSLHRIDRLLNELEDVKSEVAMMHSRFVQLNAREYSGELCRTVADPYPQMSLRRSSGANSDKESPTHAHQILKKYKLRSPKMSRSSRASAVSPPKVPICSAALTSPTWTNSDLFSGIVIRGDTMTVSLSERSDSGVSSVMSSENHSKVTSPELDAARIDSVNSRVDLSSKPGLHYERDKKSFIEEVRNISQDVSVLIQYDLCSKGSALTTSDSGPAMLYNSGNPMHPPSDNSSGNHDNQPTQNNDPTTGVFSDEDIMSVSEIESALDMSPKDQLMEDQAQGLDNEVTSVKDMHEGITSVNNTRRSVSELCKITSYVAKEWRGSTDKADRIRQGYSEIVDNWGFHYLRQIRGDNYCAIRATLYQVLVNNTGQFTELKELKMKLETLLCGCHSYLKGWSFANRLSRDINTVDMMGVCLDKLLSVVKEVSQYSSFRTREERILELFNADDSTDLFLMEAVKIIMMLTAIDLHDASCRGEDVPVFVWLMFARDTSETPAMLLKNHLNCVGDSGGLEQVEMFLLAHCLNIGIQVLRPSQQGQPDFVTYFPDDAKDRSLPLVSLIAEDDRHYNVAL